MILTSVVRSLRALRLFSLRFTRKSLVFVRLASLAGAMILWIGAATHVLATPINLGSFSGATVDYTGVQEDSNSGDPPGLFGLPTTVGPVTPGYPGVPCVLCGIPGNSLTFNPVGFSAQAAGANGVDLTDGQLKFVVDAKGPTVINNIQITEAGDTTLGGFGTNGTTTSVFASVFVEISQVDNIGISPVKVTLQMPFTATPSFPVGPKLNPQNQFRLGTDGLGGPIYQSTWNGNLPINVGALLTAAGIGFNGGATLVTINIDNVLIATSENGTQSSIAKKQGGVIITTNFPEPTSVLMAVIGFVGLVAARRFRIA